MNCPNFMTKVCREPTRFAHKIVPSRWRGDEITCVSAYAEDTPLTSVFGDGPRVRIISALLSEWEHDVNRSDLAHLTGLDPSSVERHLDALLAIGLVVRTRKLGDTQMYALNKESRLVRLLRGVEWCVLEWWHRRENGVNR